MILAQIGNLIFGKQFLGQLPRKGVEIRRARIRVRENHPAAIAIRPQLRVILRLEFRGVVAGDEQNRRIQPLAPVALDRHDLPVDDALQFAAGDARQMQ